MKRIAACLFALVLFAFAFPASALAADSFLVGEWSTSDGSATMTFRNDGTCVSDFGFMPEEGTWSAQDTGGDAFSIEIEGSSILYLMQLAYGGADEGYHFEVLKCNDDNFCLVQVYGDYTAWSSPCKLGFTRKGKKADFTLPAEPAASGASRQTEVEDPNEVKTKKIEFDSKNVVDLNWGWNLFNKDSSEYDHNLAMVGVILGQAAETSQDYIWQRLDDLGFENMKPVFYDGETDNQDHPATIFASKRISLNGADKTVVCVVVRGTTNFQDVLTDIGAMFDGFYTAAHNVRTEFDAYYDSLEQLYGDVSPENTILFITGHSLGGAVAGQLGQMLEGSYSHRNTIFDYTFASPNYETFKYDVEGFTNIHNIVNVHDAIPNVPTGFKKYGRIWYYDSSEGKYQSYLNRVYETLWWNAYFFLDEHYTSTYLSMMLCDVPDNMGEGAVNPYSLTSVHCPVDIEVRNQDGELMGSTKGEEVTLTEACTVLVMTDGEEKYVFAPPDEPYTVKIVGTGNGEMTVKQQSIDQYSGEVVSEKSFEHVAVTKGQQFELAVSGKAQVDDIELKGADGAAASGGSSEPSSEPASADDSGQKDEGFVFHWWYILVGLGVVALAFVILLVIGTVKNKGRAPRKRGSKAKSSASKTGKKRRK